MVIILVGPPAAGKTTVARMVCESVRHSQGYPTLHLEVDNLRWMVVGDVKDHEPEAIWIKLCEGLLESAMTQVKLVVVEGLFFQSETLIYLKEKFGAIVIVFEAELKAALHRNQQRQPVDERLADDEVQALYSLPRPPGSIRVNAAGSARDVADEIIGIITRRLDEPVCISTGL